MDWMISLRKHIDGAGTPDAAPPVKAPSSVLAPYCEALLVFGQSAQKAVPGVGGELLRNLNELNARLEQGETSEVSETTRQSVRGELDRWADRALQYHDENEREIKEIMNVVGRAAESLGKRDERHGKEIGDLTSQLRSIADLKDLAPIRRSILDSTAALRACVEKMAEENKATVSQLSAQVEQYRAKLEESEKSATVDPLTGIANRRAFEQNLDQRIATGANFSLIMMDLNDFKSVNDRFGHLAGDSLLSQFATELRAQFRSSDLVGRWGGDEFVVIVDGGIAEANGRAGRIRQWALGEYTLDAGIRKVKTLVSASIGAVEWDGCETPTQLLARADQKLYTGKGRARTESQAPVAV
jgi:diguanylate cyclase (GGDEF)-like protein